MKKILLPLLLTFTIGVQAQQKPKQTQNPKSPAGFVAPGDGSSDNQKTTGDDDIVIQPTGQPHLDAVAVDNALRTGDHATVRRVLSYYVDIDSSGLNGQRGKWKNEFLSHPAIVYPNAVMMRSAGDPSLAGVVDPQGIGEGIPFISDPTSAIDALSQFIAKRFQEELNLAYLNDFRASFDNTATGKRFSWLFPNTATLLKNVNPYSNTSFLSSLREDAQQDFYDFPSNFCVLLDSENIVKNDPRAAYFVLYANAVADLAQGDKINDIIDLLGNSKYTDQIPNTDFRSSLRLLTLLSRAFMGTDGTWLKPSQLQPLMFAKNNQLRYLFLGLLYEKEKTLFNKIVFGEQSLKDILLKDMTVVSDFCNYCVSVETHYNTLQESIGTFTSDTSNTFGNIITIARSVDGLVEDGVNILQFVIDHTDLDDKIKPVLANVQNKYLPMGEQVIDLFEAAHSKSYGLTLTLGLSLCKTLLPDSSSGTLINHLTKYGTFLVTLVQAKTSDDMLAALEAAAQPVQSYRIKRNSNFNVSINAYAGLLAGREKLLGTDSVTIANRYGWHYGFTAPVGLAFSWGLGTKNWGTDPNSKGGSSLTLFFPLVDVGAVTSFRLQDGKTQLPTLSWQNVWAPGVYLIYGFRNSPLTLNIGTQYGPDLRKIDADDNTIITSKAWKMINVGITVDIPVFNVYTWQRTSKVSVPKKADAKKNNAKNK